MGENSQRPSHTTPRNVPEVLNGLMPFEVIYLCQEVISNSTDHNHASMALTVICNMARYQKWKDE